MSDEKPWIIIPWSTSLRPFNAEALAAKDKEIEVLRAEIERLRAMDVDVYHLIKLAASLGREMTVCPCCEKDETHDDLPSPHLFKAMRLGELADRILALLAPPEPGASTDKGA